jgi:hypothetical protein
MLKRSSTDLIDAAWPSRAAAVSLPKTVAGRELNALLRLERADTISATASSVREKFPKQWRSLRFSAQT